MREELAKLKTLLRDGGLCFHGSKAHFTLVEPRQADCNSKRPENCQLAVYATPDDVAVAIVKALFDRQPGARSANFSYSRHGNGRLVVSGTNATFTPGYVHVLSSVTFDQLGDEYVSYEPVEVYATIRIDPSILRLLEDDVELHIPIPPPY